MVVRRRKKYRKKLGSRSYHGDTKNRRGKGIKGGRGRAGSWDHKKQKFKETLRGEKGFKPPRRRKEQVINVGDLDKYEENGVVDVRKYGFTKVLGRGTLTKPLKVIAPAFSERAIEKIRAAGGEAVVQ